MSLDAPPEVMDALNQLRDDLTGQIAELRELLITQRTVRDWYTTAQVAELLGRAEFTVREWCRLGRIRASKRVSGRGKYPSWVISHDELQRYQRAGLLPSSVSVPPAPEEGHPRHGS